MSGADDKTEAATPKRRGEARKKGQVAKSTELSSMVVLLGLLLALHNFGGAAGKTLQNYAENAFAHLDECGFTEVREDSRSDRQCLDGRPGRLDAHQVIGNSGRNRKCRGKCGWLLRCHETLSSERRC